MAENAPPPGSGVPPTAPGSKAPGSTPKPKREEKPIDRAHMPMAEEFDRARWTLPPMRIVGIALAILAVVVIIVSFAARSKPVASGTINSVNAVQLADNSTLAAIQLNFANVTEKPWFIKSVRATVKTDQNEYSDEAATAVDSERYFQAFPELGQGASPILKFDQKIDPGQQQAGTIVVSFPITKEQFEARKSLTISLQPFDNPTVNLKK